MLKLMFILSERQYKSDVFKLCMISTSIQRHSLDDQIARSQQRQKVEMRFSSSKVSCWSYWLQSGVYRDAEQNMTQYKPCTDRHPLPHLPMLRTIVLPLHFNSILCRVPHPCGPLYYPTISTIPLSAEFPLSWSIILPHHFNPALCFAYCQGL